MSSEQQITRRAFIWTNVLRAPFWALYGLLVFILHKDLHASGLQVALFLALKPLVSLFSIYWSQFVVNRRDRLIPNIICAGFVGYLPFFFFPFVNDPWFVIFSGALYMMLTRGIVPAWMEILKINLTQNSRENIVSYGSAISYLGGVIFPLFLGDIMDLYPGGWRWLFPAAAIFGLCGTFFQIRITLPKSSNSGEVFPNVSTTSERKTKTKIANFIFQPWRMGWALFKERDDFRHFQIGFFLGGMGLMLMQPVLPHFFCDTLKLSYTELAVALSLCKGFGFTITTRLWASLLRKVDIYRFSSVVTLLAAIFPLGLLLAQQHLVWIYFSYLSYGVMQAGSELVWHLSGPIFAKTKDSTSYSSVNVAMVGLRGCVAPFLGAFLCANYGGGGVLFLASIFCLLASIQAHFFSRKSFTLSSAGT
jgi:predicted MFS family arabinose efflux permease